MTLVDLHEHSDLSTLSADLDKSRAILGIVVQVYAIESRENLGIFQVESRKHAGPCSAIGAT